MTRVELTYPNPWTRNIRRAFAGNLNHLIGAKALYVVAGILGIALIIFFAGQTAYSETARAGTTATPVRNFDEFFMEMKNWVMCYLLMPGRKKNI